MKFAVVCLSLAAGFLSGCSTVATRPVPPPDIAATWTLPHTPIYAGGVCIGYIVSAEYAKHFTALAQEFGARLAPPLKGGEGMSPRPDGFWQVTKDRDEQNESLARWARNAGIRP